MTTTASAVVIGGGIVGASIACYLAKMGLDHVVLLERGAIGGEATGRSGALVRTDYANPWDTAIAIKSLEIFSNWSDLIGGDSPFDKTGFLRIVSPHDAAALRAQVAMLRAAGTGTRLISTEQVKELQPAFRVDDIGAAAYEPDSGYADPVATVTGMARRAGDLGVDVRAGVAVRAIRTAAGKVTAVETDAGPLTTPLAVIAAGAWSAHLARTAGVDLPLKAVVSFAGMVERPAALPQSPIACGDLSVGTYWRPGPGNLTLVGIRSPKGDHWPVVNPEDYSASVPEAWTAHSLGLIAHRIPAIAGARWRDAWGGVDGESPDQHMILDRADAVEGLYVAAGMSGAGFKTGPAVGQIMAELIPEGRARSVDIHPFRLGRFAEGDLIPDKREDSTPLALDRAAGAPASTG